MKLYPKNLEGQWKELNDVLDERARNGKERSEQLLAYEQLRDRCIQWLTTTENMLDNAQPVGLEQDIVKKQTDDLKVSLLVTFSIFWVEYPSIYTFLSFFKLIQVFLFTVREE